AAARAAPRHRHLVGPREDDRLLPRRPRNGDRPRRSQRRRLADPPCVVRRRRRRCRQPGVVHGVPRPATRRGRRRLDPPLRADHRDRGGAGGLARLPAQPGRRVHRRLRPRGVQVAVPARPRWPRRRAHDAWTGLSPDPRIL
ncbi:MAG: Glyoxalase family protein, partial [uncultured Solirubrobacteraceae bacterium]